MIFFSRSYINICRASLQARGDSLYLVQKLLITKRARERDREDKEAREKLRMNIPYPAEMGGYNDACISEFLFSKVLDSVYVSHKHSVFFFFLLYLIEIP